MGSLGCRVEGFGLGFWGLGLRIGEGLWTEPPNHQIMNE